MATERAPFRLAIRSEGDYVNAYFAALDTMDGAVLIGSMRRALLDADAELFDAWRLVLQQGFSAICRDATGIEAVFPHPPKPAPEHERSGRA